MKHEHFFCFGVFYVVSLVLFFCFFLLAVFFFFVPGVSCAKERWRGDGVMDTISFPTIDPLAGDPAGLCESEASKQHGARRERQTHTERGRDFEYRLCDRRV